MHAPLPRVYADNATPVCCLHVCVRVCACVSLCVLVLVIMVQVLAQQGRARTATMKLPHYTAETPMFMPVGTQGALPRSRSRVMEQRSLLPFFPFEG